MGATLWFVEPKEKAEGNSHRVTRAVGVASDIRCATAIQYSKKCQEIEINVLTTHVIELKLQQVLKNIGSRDTFSTSETHKHLRRKLGWVGFSRLAAIYISLG
jgi:hypothetical protein